jgi:hypothetical protein
MGNLAVAFDPESGTIGSRLHTDQGIKDLDGLLCTLVRTRGLPSAEQACALFEALLEPVFAQPASGPAPAQQGGTAPVGSRSLPARDLSGLLGGGA